MSEDKLDQFLQTGNDWEKLKTSIPGVFIQKLPPYRNAPSRLAIEVNPVDASGSPTKRRGLLIRYDDEYEAVKEMQLLDDFVFCVGNCTTGTRPIWSGDFPSRHIL